MRTTSKQRQENDEEELSSLPKETSLPSVGQHALLGWNMRTRRLFGGKTSPAGKDAASTGDVRASGATPFVALPRAEACGLALGRARSLAALD